MIARLKQIVVASIIRLNAPTHGHHHRNRGHFKQIGVTQQPSAPVLNPTVIGLMDKNAAYVEKDFTATEITIVGEKVSRFDFQGKLACKYNVLNEMCLALVPDRNNSLIHQIIAALDDKSPTCTKIFIRNE